MYMYMYVYNIMCTCMFTGMNSMCIYCIELDIIPACLSFPKHTIL